jgi:hypothetical protein
MKTTAGALRELLDAVEGYDGSAERGVRVYEAKKAARRALEAETPEAVADRADVIDDTRTVLEDIRHLLGPMDGQSPPDHNLIEVAQDVEHSVGLLVRSHVQLRVATRRVIDAEHDSTFGRVGGHEALQDALEAADAALVSVGTGDLVPVPTAVLERAAEASRSVAGFEFAEALLAAARGESVTWPTEDRA